MSCFDHALYALFWLSFGLLHSLLAGRRGHHALRPLAGQWCRLAYNLIAVVHLAVVLAVGRLVLGANAVPYDRPPALVVVQLSALALAVVLYWAGGRRYDLGRFLGTSPDRPGDTPEPLVVDGVHAYLRHPLYAGACLLLFGLVTDPLSLATALWGSAYLGLGTWVEERRLADVYGEPYRAYRRQVPALLPRLRPYRPS